MECNGSAKKHYETSITIYGRTVCFWKRGQQLQLRPQVHILMTNVSKHFYSLYCKLYTNFPSLGTVLPENILNRFMLIYKESFLTYSSGTFQVQETVFKTLYFPEVADTVFPKGLSIENCFFTETALTCVHIHIIKTTLSPGLVSGFSISFRGNWSFSFRNPHISMCIWCSSVRNVPNPRTICNGKKKAQG